MNWRRFFTRDQADIEQRQELEFYVEITTEEYIAQGMDPETAHQAAKRKLGNPTQIQEEVYQMNTLALLDSIGQDVRYALRALRQNLMFSMIAVLTLALGIGANSGMFSLVYSVLIQPLPFPDSDRLVRIWSSTGDAPRQVTALPDYREWRQGNKSFEEMGAYRFLPYNLTGVESPERLQAVRVTASIWSTLRIQPLLGRTFDESAELWGEHRVVLLSETFWRSRFGSDPGIVGQAIQLNGESHIVLGVMPAASQWPGPLTQIWTPMAFRPGDNLNTRNNRFSDVIARLKPGVSILEAQKDLASVAARIAADVPQNAGFGVTTVDLQDTYVANIRPTLQLLFGAAGVVLLIACGNIANLLLARGTARRAELTMRVALGSGRRRLIRQLLTESVILATLGTVVGIGIGYGLMRLFVALAPVGSPRFREVALGAPVVAFTVAVGFLTVLIFGLWPAWSASRLDVNRALRESGRGTPAGRSGLVRKILVAAQVALSLMLLIDASLLVSSLARAQQVDPGFSPENLLTAQVNLPPTRYSQDRAAAFMETAAQELTSLAGVEAATTTALPLGGLAWGKYFTIEGRTPPPDLTQVPSINYVQVTPSYFAAMHANLRRGRFLGAEDHSSGERVAVVNETLARRFWPDGDPLGKRIALLPPESLMKDPPANGYASYWMTIVGIVADLRTFGPETQPNPEVFAPLTQHHDETQNSFFIVARTKTDPQSSIKTVQGAMHTLDPNVPLVDLQPMESRLSNSLARRRFSLLQLGLFAGLALLLAIIGLYGVIAYAVGARTQEMGIRAALGATPTDLIRLVVREGFSLGLIGVVIGLGLASATSSLITSELFQVKAVDPMHYVAASAVMLILALVACVVPSRRAAGMDPATTLRYN